MPLDGERSVALLKLPDMGSKLRLLLLYLNLLPDGHCGAAVSDVSDDTRFFCKTLSLEWAVVFSAFQAVAESLIVFMLFSC